ncbi:hypothetical protein SEMRO_1416_G270780.1 [Seminavis robusta]|uniref:Uncharacterized protein n=1 Tax=Seminavis robusta TaxID=568900 RepID=A0A9N8HQ96_9STRA|nr:hypothetical protein SEMRO_1416_G270780.1 [Seminavis robusta]|eukprot:Sro1416_g270780.1 n/a (384) ;mRNA; f:1371-2631
MNNNSPLRVFDLSSLPLYPIDSTMADSKPSAQPSATKTDTTMADPSSAQPSATKTDTTMADPSSTKRKWKTDPNFAEFRGIQTTEIKGAMNMHHQVDAAAWHSRVLYTDENGKVLYAVTVVMPSLVCHQAFNKKYLGPPGVNHPVLPWYQLPDKEPSDDVDDVEAITVQCCNMHGIALLAQHGWWANAVVKSGGQLEEHAQHLVQTLVHRLVQTLVHDGEGDCIMFLRGSILPPEELATAPSAFRDASETPPDADLMAMIKEQIEASLQRQEQEGARGEALVAKKDQKDGGAKKDKQDDGSKKDKQDDGSKKDVNKPFKQALHPFIRPGEASSSDSGSDDDDEVMEMPPPAPRKIDAVDLTNVDTTDDDEEDEDSDEEDSNSK